MLISSRFLLALVFGIVAAAGIIMLAERVTHQWIAWLNVACGVVGSVVLFLPRSSTSPTLRRETDNINDLSPQRRRELVRGTSLYLRELHYRYSIRFAPTETGELRPFSAEVNTIKLGFVPVMIIDNTNDRQGYGYVAFVHDGKRWRGPGLPCPAGQVEAVRHAAKCVSPLCKEEETHY
jgi:hypothetical protein